MSAYFHPIIINAFPEQTWATILKSVTDGVTLADSLLRQERWLNWPVGRDQRGDLRRVGAMWGLRGACLSADLPFACIDRENTAKNCHHIEVRSQNVYLHVNRTDSLLSMPRDTRFRNDERASNQLDLFRPPLLTTDLDGIKYWYGWLTFNADADGRLTHLAIGLPESEGNEWLDIVSLPLAGDSGSLNEDDEPRPPGPEHLVRFKENIQRFLEQNSDRKDADESAGEGP